MPILVECSVCGKKYRLGEDRAGSTIECKECFGEIDVPGRRARSSSPRRAASPNRPQRRSSSSSGVNPLLLIGGILGGVVFLIVALVVVVVIMLPDKAADPNPNNFARQNRPVIPQMPAPRAPNFPRGPRAPNFPRGPRAPNFPRVPRPVPGRMRPAPNIPRPNNAVPNVPVPKVPEPAKLDLIAWNVEVDPPAETYEFDIEKDIRIPTGDRFGAGNMLLPAMPTAFVLVGRNSNDREKSTIYDLRTRKKVADVTGIKIDSNASRLSQDCKFLVGRMLIEGNLLVYDVKAEKPLGKIPTKQQYPSLQTFELPGSKRIVAWASNKPVTIWSLPAGDVERTIELPNGYHIQSIAFSPGGRAMTVSHEGNKILRVYDLDNGQPVGEVAAPLDERNRAERCLCLVFSHDGKELAGLFGTFKSRLVAWDIADGKTAVDHKFGESLRSTIKGAFGYRAPPLEWFPDRSKWLVYGHAIVDREAGGPVWSAPVDTGGTATRRMIDNGRVLTISGARGSRSVASLKLPQEEITQAIALVRSGGTSADVGLPPLTLPDQKTVQEIDTTAAIGNWQVKADAGPKLPAGSLSKPLTLNTKGIEILQALLSRSGTRLIVNRTPARPTGGAKSDSNSTEKPPKSMLSVYDVANGDELKQIPLSFNCTLTAVNAKGTRCLIRPGQGRVDVYSIDDGSHIAGWRPYQTGDKRFRNVEFAAFIDDTHVLTRGGMNQVVLWEIPSCKAVYSFETHLNPMLSAGGKYLAVAGKTDHDVRFYEPLTGQPRGGLKLSSAVRGGLAFHPGGERLAVIAGGTIKLYSLKDGKKEKEFRVAKGGRTLKWCGDRHLLADNRLLIDIDKGLNVWNYNVHLFNNGNARNLEQSLDGRHWFIAPDSPINKTAALCAVTLPHPEAVTKLSATALKAKTILGPGTKVSLNVNFNTPAGMSNITNQFKQRLIAALKRNGITDAAGQQVVLTATMSRQSTGKILEYELTEGSRFGIGGKKKEIKLSETKVECNIAMTHRGKSYGTSNRSFSNDLVNLIQARLPKGKTAEQYLAERQWQNATRHILAYSPPTLIYSADAGTGFGSSQITSTGFKAMQLPSGK